MRTRGSKRCQLRRWLDNSSGTDTLKGSPLHPWWRRLSKVWRPRSRVCRTTSFRPGMPTPPEKLIGDFLLLVGTHLHSAPQEVVTAIEWAGTAPSPLEGDSGPPPPAVLLALASMPLVRDLGPANRACRGRAPPPSTSPVDRRPSSTNPVPLPNTIRRRRLPAHGRELTLESKLLWSVWGTFQLAQLSGEPAGQQYGV